jgi:hypothetical protein
VRGTLHTNILNLPLPASNASFYKSFEGRNFAKIVLNAAILTLAKAQVLHKILAGATATKTILAADSGDRDRPNFRHYSDEEQFEYTLAKGRKKRGDIHDENQWNDIILIAQHKFAKAVQENKFKVEAPLPSPYFLSL